MLADVCGYAQKEQKRVAIAFYNVENLFDTINDPSTDDDAFTPKGAYKYTHEMYRKKLHNIAYVLQQIGAKPNSGPALIGLAEIENGMVLQDLVNEKEIKGSGYKYISYDSPDPRGIDVALLYRSKYFRPLASRPLHVRVESNGHSEATRDILYVTGLLDKDTIHILVNHWPSRREGIGETAPKRAQVALANKHIADSLTKKNPKCRIILMGDLNDDPTDVSVATILGAKAGRDGIIPRGLYNPWTDIYLSGQGSVAYRKKWNLFDQVIVSRTLLHKGPGWKFARAEVFDREFLKTYSGKQQGYPFRSWRGYHWMNGYSDHFPVVLYLEK